MSYEIKSIAFFIGLIFFVFIWSMIRKNFFRPSYAFWWLTISIFLLSIPVLEKFYKYVATDIIGLNDARHIIYIIIIGFLLMFVFYLTTFINKMNDKIQELISSNAILDSKVMKLEDKNEN